MSFNESINGLLSPSVVDEIAEDLSTMYVVCPGRKNQAPIGADVPPTFQPFDNRPFPSLLFNRLRSCPVIDGTPRDPPQLVGFAGFTILIYDHLITFGDEVRHSLISTTTLI